MIRPESIVRVVCATVRRDEVDNIAESVEAGTLGIVLDFDDTQACYSVRFEKDGYRLTPPLVVSSDALELVIDSSKE